MVARLYRSLASLALLAVATLAPTAASAAAPKHLILIMMENHGTDTIFGNKEDAPFINDLIGQNGVRRATQYYGVTHPSLPNYLALASGDYQGIHDDCKADPALTCAPVEFVPSAHGAVGGNMLTDEQVAAAAKMAHVFPGKTLIDQLDDARIGWKIYMQGMAADGKLDEYAPLDASGAVAAKLYAQKHNPFVYFASFRDSPARLARLLPYDAFLADLQGNTLPTFSWISPDQCHDMHGIAPDSASAIGNPDCAYVKSGLDHKVIKLGDIWLKQTIDTIRAAPVWRDDTAIVVVWDEDDYAGNAGIKGSPIGRNGVVLGGDRAPLIAVTSKDDAPRKLDTPYNHYNLLASLEKAYGLPCLAHACDVGDALMTGLLD